jgi:hypothetical protein
LSESDAQADLHASLLTLTEKWAETRAQWQDSVAAEFERDIWDDIVQMTRSIERSAATLNDVIEQALRRTET